MSMFFEQSYAVHNFIRQNNTSKNIINYGVQLWLCYIHYAHFFFSLALYPKYLKSQPL